MRYILSLLCVFILGISHGQSLHFEALSNNFEMPSKECYNILKDSKGYIWWSSEQGLCKFDGAKITVFNRSTGFHDKASYALVEDAQNRLWIFGANRNIYYHFNGKIYKAPFSDFIKSKTSFYEIPNSLDLINSGKTLLVNTNKSTFEVNLKTAKVRTIPTSSYNHILAFQNSAEQITLRSSFSNIHLSTSERTLGIFNEQNQITKTINLGKAFKQIIKSRAVLAKKGQKSFIGIDMLLITMQGNTVLDFRKLPQKILSIVIDKNNNLLIGTRKKGLLIYRNLDLSTPPTTALPNLSVSGIYVDSNEQIWCTTLEKGVFRCENPYLKVISDDKINPQTYEVLKTVNDRLFTANDPNFIVELNNDKRTFHKVPERFSEMFRDIVNHKGQWYIASHQYIASTDENISNLKFLTGKQKANKNALSFHVVNDQLYYLSIRYLGEISANKIDSVVSFPFKVRSGCYLANHTWLLATSDALYYLNTKSKKITEIAKIPDPVNAIYEDHKKRFWIATKGSGLFLFHNGKLTKYARKGLEEAVYIYDVKQHPDGNLWLATNSGIFRFDPNNQTVAVERTTKNQGFISNEIYCTAFCKGIYYAATADGLCSFTTQIFKKNNTKTILYFSEALIDGQKRNLNALKKGISYNSGTLQFKFNIVDFQNTNRFLHYELSGTQSRKRTLAADYVSLDNLKPGKYQLKVWVPQTKKNKASNSISIDFEVEKPFWLYTEFLIFFILVCLLLVGLAFRFLLNRYKKKEREKTQIHKLIMESKMAAMQAQMNPHFIFNAINGIQNYVLNKESDLAYDYLTKFSRLIRKVLHNSQSPLLPLSEELETLKLYVSLEQLRFEQAFDYEVVIDSKIDIFQTYIPPMLIQPYIENAIWHGIMARPKQFKGHIKVAFLSSGEQLIIKISDNGIGRKASQQLKENQEHQSLGMTISSERLEMVQRFYQVQALSIDVSDLIENNQVTGTLVQICLPNNLTTDS